MPKSMTTLPTQSKAMDHCFTRRRSLFHACMISLGREQKSLQGIKEALAKGAKAHTKQKSHSRSARNYVKPQDIHARGNWRLFLMSAEQKQKAWI
ncbi:hypothetical protein PSHT_16368, partial [Puccinia striiformis]